MTFANLEGQYAILTLRTAGLPFFVVYTKPVGDGNDEASWYRSRHVFWSDIDASAYVGQTVMMYWGNDPGRLCRPPSHPVYGRLRDHRRSSATPEEILFGNISTSTSYPAGTYEFVISDLAYQYNSIVYQSQLASPPSSEAPATPDDAFIRIDGVNDYISLGGTGAILDYTASWTVACEIVEMPSNTTDSKFMTLFRSVTTV